MDKQRIGDLAGEVWRTLDKRTDLSIQELARMLSENVMDVAMAMAMAVGWLAREDKVFFRTKENNEELIRVLQNRFNFFANGVFLVFTFYICENMLWMAGRSLICCAHYQRIGGMLEK